MTTVVVSAPGLGDEIQAIKAGILEIADIHVVSKCDRSDANRTMTDLKMMLKDGLAGHAPAAWRPPVIGTSAMNDEGFDELLAGFEKHLAAMADEPGRKRQARISAFRLEKSAETLLLEKFRRQTDFATPAAHVAERGTDPYSAAAALVAHFSNEDR